MILDLTIKLISNCYLIDASRDNQQKWQDWKENETSRQEKETTSYDKWRCARLHGYTKRRTFDPCEVRKSPQSFTLMQVIIHLI